MAEYIVSLEKQAAEARSRGGSQPKSETLASGVLTNDQAKAGNIQQTHGAGGSFSRGRRPGDSAKLYIAVWLVLNMMFVLEDQELIIFFASLLLVKEP